MTSDQPNNNVPRRIIHIDMDAFYASIEQRDNATLRAKPLVVGREHGRGVVVAASYEARKYGVRSAMPCVIAKRLCPSLVFTPPRFDVYRQVSTQIQRIFFTMTPLVQPLALDEAYLDVTSCIGTFKSGKEIARHLKDQIRYDTGLTASAGISYNKFLAKLASEERKPDGIFVIPPDAGPEYVASLAIERFYGVGPATSRKMHRLGIKSGADIRATPLDVLCAHFGKAGRLYHDMARAIDHRPVDAMRQRKSIGTETTFPQDVANYDEIFSLIENLSWKVWCTLTASGLQARTVVIKIRFADFITHTRTSTQLHPFEDSEKLARIAQRLLSSFAPLRTGVRLLGVSVCGFGAKSGPSDRQLSFL